MIAAVLPFAADGIDPDAQDLALWMGAETARELRGLDVRLVVDAVEIAPAALADAAERLGADVALGAMLQLGEGHVEVRGVLANRDGSLRAEWNEWSALGSALQLPRRLARDVLLSLGEDAPSESAEPEAAADAAVRLARAARRGDLDELLALARLLPAARDALLRGAEEASGSARMPEHFSMLERLAQATRGDARVLLALADYRALHLDEEGAREMYVAARDAAQEASLAAEASLRLAGLAEKAGRASEAILHLRAALRRVDDAATYTRLGTLLADTDPAAALAAFRRAAVLTK
ncbi:MAG TPA: hypothetical protein VFE90_14445 [Myxococcales bacterium]|nr:hypothetical protein [Myxococcales bacterium]